MFALLPTSVPAHRACPTCNVPVRAGHSTRKRPRAINPDHHSQPADDAGNEDVQQSLMDVIRVQIGQVKVNEFVQEERQRLRQAAEEAKDEVDQLSKLTRNRSNTAFDRATADIDKLADEYEAQLKSSRDKLEADDKDFLDWEEKTAIKRSEGTFFKGLYTTKKRLPNAKASAAIKTEMQAQEAEQRAEAIDAAIDQKQQEQEAKKGPSAFKLYTTCALTAILSFVVVSDALSPAPSWGQDAIYVAIVILLGLNLLNKGY